MRRKNRWIVALLVAALLGWVLVDLYGPRRASLRDFDPVAVARLETSMWRAYYDKREAALFRDMARLLRTQYHLPVLRAHTVAYQTARGAFVFKRGKTRPDYEQALPYLERYYGEIREVSDTPFEVADVARLELEWWIIHRQRGQYRPEDLVRALAELQAAIYRLPASRLEEHARLRAEAMTLRDDRAAAGGVTDAEWDRIDALLRDSYRALSREVRT
jgi:hypothetical protein